MLRRTMLLMIPLSLASMPLSAQSGLSVVGGVTSATISAEDIPANNLKSRTGVAIGIGLNHGATSGMSFAPEVLYAMKGSNYKNTSSYVKLDYVTAPLLFRYGLGAGDQIRPFLTAGPTIGYLLSCKIGDANDSESCDDDSTKKFDYGAMFGAGVKFGQFGVSARYDLGIANIAKNSSSTVKNKGMMLLGSISF